MWCTLHLVAFLILNTFYCHFDVIAIWLHNFDLFSYRELVSLGDTIFSFFICLSHNTQISIFFNIRIIIINLCFLSWFSVKESGGKLPVSTV